jgi:DNA-binding IclR family transcriptional regulator
MDEVLAELSRLERVVPEGPAGFTNRELADALGLHHNAAQSRLTDMVRSGRVAFVGHRSALNIAGRRCRIPVYRMVSS